MSGRSHGVFQCFVYLHGSRRLECLFGVSQFCELCLFVCAVVVRDAIEEVNFYSVFFSFWLGALVSARAFTSEAMSEHGMDMGQGSDLSCCPRTQSGQAIHGCIIAELCLVLSHTDVKHICISQRSMARPG